MLTIAGLWKAFGSRDLFRGADMFVSARDRVALVGLNGTGKTTLIEMIAGEQSPDRGSIDMHSEVVVGYLPQETDALRGRSVIEEVLSVGSDVTDAAHRLKVLENEIAATDGTERDRLVAEFGDLHDRFATLGGYSIEYQARRILAGLGFAPDDLERQTDTLSGGWLMRIALAKLLLAGPDLLMLDEPTNHLDVESVEWLERFLGAYEGAVILISHDRDFINGIATKVVEIDDRKLVSYTGDYESFVAQRQLAAEQALAQARNQQLRRAQLERFIERFRYKKTKARQVQSKIKLLDRMESVDLRRDARTVGFNFPSPPKAGRVVLELDKVSFAYDEKPVYENLDLVMERDHKIAIVGPNGAGKTTLLKLLAGVLEPAAGERRLGHNAQVAYFAQHQIEALDPDNTVKQEVERAVPRGADVDVRRLMGRFLFTGDDVDKRIGVLSGGERTRVALAKMLVAPANVLCLDEPTNHLDIPSRDVLEDALLAYAGSFVLITHDRHLIRSVANRIVEVRAGSVTEYAGDYEYYLTKRQPYEDEQPVEGVMGPSRTTRKDERRRAAEHRAATKKLRDRVKAIEQEIDELAAENARISQILSDPSAYTQGEDFVGLGRDFDANRRRVELLEQEWAEVAAELERADQETAGSPSTTR